ncbi:MAG: Uma2 family endonuclease, partial [Planctomycetota bacterium]|nr:Uma2 family endonuclease [Planctomycetota bacterium]
RLLTESLHGSWAGPGEGRSFVAFANVGLFYGLKEQPFVPDAMLSLDVTLPADLFPKRNRSYFTWEYGKTPEVVIEVVSNKEGHEDGLKLEGYRKIRIPYYVIYDPEHHLSNEDLRVFCLRDASWQRMAEPIVFADVQLGMQLWTGSYENCEATWLRWVDADGTLIPTGAEQNEEERDRANQERDRANQERDRANQERDRANQERDRANQERDRAGQERDRAERMAEKLRSLGVNPDE